MMKKWIFLAVALIGLSGIRFAEARHYSSQQIERYVNRTPREDENNLSTLVSYLTKPFDNDYDKAKAIAFWIASRINYDAYLYNNGKMSRLIKNYDGQEPLELLRSRVGICGDFANLFMAMCRKAGVRAYYIKGFAYPAGQSLTATDRRNSGHAWNSFSYQGEKIYVDTTFMAKGKTAVSGSASQTGRRRALIDVKKDNKRKSQINDFDDFYFDFTYKDEKQKRRYQRQER